MNEFNSDFKLIDVRHNAGFSPKDSCSFSNIIIFRDLPYSFDLANQELVRYPAYFYGFSFDKLRCDYSLWLTTGTKKNINILMPFFFNFPNNKLSWHLNKKSKSWYLYLIQNSFLHADRSQVNYIYKHKNFYEYNQGLSDVTLNLQKFSNKFHRVINGFNLELDFSISTYNYNWLSSKNLNYKNRNLFNLVNDSFLYSSFFINSFDSSVILYPQAFFEYNYFSYFLSNSFNISNIFSLVSFNKFIYISLINFLQKAYFSVFMINYIDINNLNLSLIILIKLLFFRIFKKKCSFNYIVFSKFKLNTNVVFYYLNIFFPNTSILQLPLKLILDSYLKPNIIFFNKYNRNNKLILFKFFLSSIKKFKHNIPIILNKTNSFLTSSSSDLGISALNWVFYYLKERKNFILNSKLVSKIFNLNSVSINNLFFNYTISNLFIRNDFLFKTFWYKSKFDKNMLIYSWANKYSFGNKRAYSGLFFLSNTTSSFVYYKYNSVLFDSIILFFDNLFKFISFNINNFLIMSFNFIYFDLYLLLYNFYNFFFKFIKQINQNKSKFFYNNLFLKFFSIRKAVNDKLLYSNIPSFGKLVKNRKIYRFYL